MKRLTVFFIMILCIVSCVKDGQGGVNLKVGDKVPDFTVTMNDGTTVTGEMLREGVSLIMFFTTGCKDCRQTLPHIQRIYDEFLPKGVRFAIISREDGPESVAAYWAENGFDMPYSAQTDRKMYNLFAKDRVPRVFVNHQGVIRFSHSDSPNPTYDLLKSDLESLLNN